MEALSPADMEALRGLDPDGTILDEVAEDLGGNDGRAFNILRNATEDNVRESMAAAQALRLDERIVDDLGSHPRRGADAAFDSMEGSRGRSARPGWRGSTNTVSMPTSKSKLVTAPGPRGAEPRTGPTRYRALATTVSAGQTAWPAAYAGSSAAAAERRTYWKPISTPGVWSSRASR